MFSAELREKAEELIGRYPAGRSALLPLLHLVQSQDGYLSDDGIAECAELLGLTKAEVAAVATFYTMYKREPLGRHLISVCTNFSCKVRGAQDVYDRLSDTLGVGHNQTTDDGMFTLEHAECLGNCEGAPIVSVDYYNYECMTPRGAEQLLEQVASGEVPEPTRGLRSPGIRMVSHRLAGLGPHPDDAERGAELGIARGTAGGAPPPAASEVGPQATVQVVAADVVADGGQPRDVEEEAGPYAREQPTDDRADAGATGQGAAEPPGETGGPDADAAAPHTPDGGRASDGNAADGTDQAAHADDDRKATDG